MNELYHYGTPRHSGRYPWGSGENPYQHTGSLTGVVKDLKAQGLTEKEIAETLGTSTTKLRAQLALEKQRIKNEEYEKAVALKEAGYSNVAIGKELGRGESYVRNLLDPHAKARASMIETTADMLKEELEKNPYLDIGEGTEQYLGVARTKLMTSVEMLKEEGYKVHYIQIKNSSGNKTTMMVLTKGDVDYREVYLNRDKVQVPKFYIDDDGDAPIFRTIQDPVSIKSSRILVNYAEDGGLDKDGLIEVRRGVDDLSLGKSNYVQGRILVDGTHYLKGMIVYSDDLPPGVDIRFNTNKHRGTPMLGPKDNTVLKPIEDDMDNPFGATVRQRTYLGKDGKEHLSPVNIVNAEGDWDNWSKKFSSQFLSKQSPELAKRQLDLTYEQKRSEFNDILQLTNPSVRQRLLQSFADDCDSSAVHLKAAGLPRTSNKVLVPFTDIKDTEVYAPGFKNGERVVLVRHPHGGIFEIPELVVNNKSPQAKKTIGNAVDAIGINAKVAQQLSGADFDGDTVLIIPNNSGKIQTKKYYESLKDFDPKERYKGYDGMKVISERNKQLKMGEVSNLITDMTIKGATDDEIVRAVKHSMVVIDAKKHRLDWKRSYEENGIAELREKYQGSARGGASTLISKAKSPIYVDPFKEVPTYKMTAEERERYDAGKKVIRYEPETYTKTNKETGEVKTYDKKVKIPKMSYYEDAYELSSGKYIENVYAAYANSMKDMANEARKEMRSTESIRYSPSAKKVYSKQVDSLDAKLSEAKKNQPLERKAQAIAGVVVSEVSKANPELDNDDIKKLRNRALADARAKTGASKSQIYIEDDEWEAIQAGAITKSKLDSILGNADLDRVKELATPRSNKGLSAAVLSRAESMMNRGYTQAEVADALGVSVGALNSAMAKEKRS